MAAPHSEAQASLLGKGSSCCSNAASVQAQMSKSTAFALLCYFSFVDNITTVFLEALRDY